MTEPLNIHNALPDGTELLHYRLGGELGRGGFGLTYRAQDTKLDRPVVIKEYLPQDIAGRRSDHTVSPQTGNLADNFQSGLDSFLKEAKTLAKFHHSNIVPILDYFKENGTAYLVMPFLEGQTLADRLARQPGGKMSEAEVMAWLNPLLDGLQTIHAAGFLHRDIKPDNIFLQNNGNPILIDFGAARNALANRSRSLSVVLTPGYAPAEQYTAAAANQGPWTDLYALGAVIFRCLTGTEPTDSTERQDATSNGEPDPFTPRLRELTKVAGPGLARAVEGCLRVARKNRIQGVAELRQVLDNRQPLKSESIKPARPRETTETPPASNAKMTAVIIGLLLVALLWVTFGYRQAVTPPISSALQVPGSTPPPITPNYTNSIGMDFVLIPAGSFLMGSDPQKDSKAYDDEFPQHRVSISQPFYLGKYEVTQEQWAAVMGSNPSSFKGRTNPVEQVSWDDVQVFIKELNLKEGTGKYRLPTEAEWEYAARAGTNSPYSFGDDESELGDYAWYGHNSGHNTHPVGRKQPNAWGLHDMHGNVWEWVEDWYGVYSSSHSSDPRGPSSGSLRVNRGESWYSPAEDCRSAIRSYASPGSRYSRLLGFRLALSPGQ
ncbi:MAG: SUMF1/EgtB/PvdO family nonheme iron enzyme [Candidatus Adiutrix sp.]|jgi:formylglycine-generating enzyme required for sulfatase activity|nr:SUMF1/EgtB/PvdO family nonheme iron enzyme [Candidatus Adiutrix sp.]